MEEPKRIIIPGWRYFHCERCGTRWREATRDIRSRSATPCFNKNCDEDAARPTTMKERRDSDYCTDDGDWRVDKSGNLINPPADELTVWAGEQKEAGDGS